MHGPDATRLPVPGRRAGVVLALLLVLGPVVGPVAADGTASADPSGDAEVRVSGGELTLQAGPGQVVAGTASVPAGTELSVRVRSTGGQPFLRTVPTLVDERGTFRAVLDLTEVPADTPIRVAVHRGGEPLATVNGTVVACSSACDAPTPADPAATTSLALDDGRVQFGAAAGRALRGETDLPPGTTLAVRVKSAGGSSPFIVSREAVVGADGRFRTVYDLADVDPGTPVSVSVVYNDTQVAEARGEVGACLRRCGAATATPTTTSAALPGANVTGLPTRTPTSQPLVPRPLAAVVTLALGGLIGVAGIALLLGLVRP